MTISRLRGAPIRISDSDGGRAIRVQIARYNNLPVQGAPAPARRAGHARAGSPAYFRRAPMLCTYGRTRARRYRCGAIARGAGAGSVSVEGGEARRAVHAQ